MGNYTTVQEAQAALGANQYVGVNQDGSFGIWDKDAEGKWIATCVYAYQVAGIEFPAVFYGLSAQVQGQGAPQSPDTISDLGEALPVELVSAEAEPHEPPSSPSTPAGSSGESIDLSESNLQNPKKKISKPVVIGICVIVALVLVVCIGGAIGSSGTGKTSSTSKPPTSTQQSAGKEAEKTKKPVSKRDLNSALELYSDKDISGYTEATASSFSIALEKAQDISAKEDVTQAEIDSATKALKNAADGLEEKIEPVIFSGSGSDVLDIPSGLEICLVTASNSGAHNFVIWSLDSDMENVDLLVNTIGSYEGTTITGMASGTAKHLQIESDGNWSITLSPIDQAEKANSGSSFLGDNVVLVNASGAKKMSFTNDGPSNFIVYGIGSSSADLLVNEIGSYTGTVPYKNYSLLIVQSSGTWTVSWE